MSRAETADAAGREITANHLAALFDQLIPGDRVRWPAFSDALDIAGFAPTLGPELCAVASDWGDALAALPAPARVAFLGERERDSVALFSALLTAVHRAYYTAPAVLAVVRAIAESGPREPTPLFDPTLVETVLARGAGKRRL